ncbi:hypothetical protein FRB99_006751 [Tulasnella sp. 403]|nr:hypothetical protein FRB99_006751 [Tulasnella sp. 403]
MSLPTQATLNPPAPSSIGATYGILSRFTLRSSDVIDEHLKVQVVEERSGRVEWTQERSLTESEIIETIKHDPSGRVCWTIHRPVQGWYIRLRSPMLPPGALVPFTPLSVAAQRTQFPSAEPTDGSFTFSCRTMSLDLSSRYTNVRPMNTPSGHSYPPSPRGSISSSSTSSNTLVQDDAVRTAGTTTDPPPRPQSQITHFLVTPHEHPTATPEERAQHRVSGFFSTLGKKLVGALETKKSFTIRIPAYPPSPTLPPAPLLTLLTFHDTTPALRLGTPTSGTLELDEGIARILGVDRGFYIAIALAFLEFQSDKEGYLAAANG